MSTRASRLFRLLVAAAALACGISIHTSAAGPAQPAAPAPDRAGLEQAVRARETAFAKTMADRDHAAFASFVSQEAVFFGARPIRGRAAIAAAWKPFFEKPAAPFSWTPEIVVVLDSGRLALSSGPVTGPDGTRTGTFNSIWRLEDDGQWRVVFDKGCD